MNNLLKDLRLAKKQEEKVSAVLPVSDLMIEEFTKAVELGDRRTFFYCRRKGDSCKSHFILSIQG